VRIVFTETNPVTKLSDFSYTLIGARRTNPTGPGSGGQPPPDITLLSTGTSSPLWVQGSCTNGGTDPIADCTIDPSTTALPVSDVLTTGWTPIPPTPTTLWDKLSDQLDTTGVTTSSQNKIAQVALAPVSPPGGTNPTIELRAASVGAAAKLKIHVYDSTSMNQLVVSSNISVNSSVDNSGNWNLTPAERLLIPDAAYQHLTLGIEMTNNKSVNVYGIALDTGGPGLLTVKGSLYVNSANSAAVRLTGKKTATKLVISPGDFRILTPGGCSGCGSQTVSCPACPGGWQPISYPTSLLDPLRSLAAPPEPTTAGSCSGSVCQPGRYDAILARTANTTLNPGIYYLKQGISITGSASITCPAPCTGGVMLYVANGSVTFAGGSTIDLTAPNSGVYKDILIFQARSDANPVKVAGNAGSSTPIKFNGYIYVPNSTQVTLATGSATLTAKAIVAQNIKVSSSVTIG
jgi:hypothetical protein